MAAALQFPFTREQWEELERQAMIYKYIIASLPVPTHLLFPAQFTTTTNSGVGVYGWRYSSAASNSKDAEPGRCRRTDGKKWRCSRDVAPSHRYCERHMKRGRPRSRKHVEVQPLLSQNNNSSNIISNKKTRLSNTIDSIPVGLPNSQDIGQSIGTNNILPEMNTDLSIKTFANRGVNWVMEDTVPGIQEVEQQWANLMNQKTDGHPYIFQQQYQGEGLDLFSNLSNDESQSFLNSDNQSKGGVIDAWSNDCLIRTTNSTDNDGSSLSSPRGNISPSSLTLSMAIAAGNIIDEEMEYIQEEGCDHRNKDTNFFTTNSWIPFASGGGPLAEVLHNGFVAVSNPASPYTGNGGSISNLSTNISSLSGVQHGAMFTESDSSVCNVAFPPAAPTEAVPFQWLN